MTPYQKQLVEDHAYLIENAIIHLRLERSDYYGDGAVGLCKAALFFDERKSLDEFRKYAFICIKREILKSVEREKRYKRQLNSATLSEIYDEDTHTYISMYEFLADGRDIEKQAYLRVLFETALSLLDGREKEMLFEYYAGYQSGEIGEIHGICRQRVLQIRKRIRHILTEAMGET